MLEVYTKGSQSFLVILNTTCKCSPGETFRTFRSRSAASTICRKTIFHVLLQGASVNKMHLRLKCSKLECGKTFQINYTVYL